MGSAHLLTNKIFMGPWTDFATDSITGPLKWKTTGEQPSERERERLRQGRLKAMLRLVRYEHSRGRDSESMRARPTAADDDDVDDMLSRLHV